jgi:hypothetical protein
VLTHESRRASSWLICNVRQDMNSPRFLGSRLYFWLVAPWVLLGVVAFIFVAKGSFEDGKKTAGMLASYLAFLCVLGMYAMVSAKHGMACGRIVAGTLALAYVAYFVVTYFVDGQSLMPSGRKSDATPFNAIWGFLVIGLPCAQFAITGVPFWRIWKKEEPNQPPEPTRPLGPSGSS